MSVFTEDQLNMLDTASLYIEDQLVDERKGVAMSYPVLSIYEGTLYFCEVEGTMINVPNELVGNYIVETSMDLRYDCTWKDLRNEDWERAEYRPVLEYKWCAL